eukprot:TRINITY_DN18926_c0_g1_i1.p1 TRINITY_DN18926_c0_g1~~TRINITY_DN18926_c0_g1_i1.p1  ORF type:complete len:658 (+),score=167.65 TRINITY_DN18926_c0_g1_i1:44-1975(+)
MTETVKQSTKLRQERTEEQLLLNEGATECIICAGLMDGDDVKFKPCRCGFRLCIWCFHKIRDESSQVNEKAKCPGCRREYNESVLKIKKVAGPDTSRKRLEGLLVVRRKVVHLTGVPKRIANEDTLKGFSYLGQYGPITNINITQGPTAAATSEVHATFVNAGDASKAVSLVDGCTTNDRVVRASHVVLRYCPAFIRNTACYMKRCAFQHTLAAEEDHVPKDKHSLKPVLASHIGNKSNSRKQGFPPVPKPKLQQKNPANPQAAPAAAGNTKPGASILPSNSVWGGARFAAQDSSATPAPTDPTPAPVSAPPAAAAQAQAVKSKAPQSSSTNEKKLSKQTKQHDSWASAAAVTVLSVSSGKRTVPKSNASARSDAQKAEHQQKMKNVVFKEEAERDGISKERTADYKGIIQSWILLMQQQEEQGIEDAAREAEARAEAEAEAQRAQAEKKKASQAVRAQQAKRTQLKATPVEVPTESERKDEAPAAECEIRGSRLAMWAADPSQALPQQQNIPKAPAKAQQTSGNGLNPMATGWTPQKFDQQEVKEPQLVAGQMPVLPGWGMPGLNPVQPVFGQQEAMAMPTQMPLDINMLGLGMMPGLQPGLAFVPQVGIPTIPVPPQMADPRLAQAQAQLPGFPTQGAAST